MRKAYFMKRGMANYHQKDQIAWVCEKSIDFHAISAFIRYFFQTLNARRN